jgi:hypothetical protein
MNPKTTGIRSGRSSWLARRHFPGPHTTLTQFALQSREPLRRHTRYATRNLQIESPVYGWAINISQSGLCMESLSELVSGARYVFRLSYGPRFLSLSGSVSWCRVDRTEMTRKGGVKVYQAGIELALDQSSEAWLEAVEQLTGATLRA